MNITFLWLISSVVSTEFFIPISITFPTKCLLTLSWPAGHICPTGHERVNKSDSYLNCSNFTSTVILSKVSFPVYLKLYKIEAPFSPNFFPFPQSIIIFLLFSTHLQPLPGFSNRACQAVYYHIPRPVKDLTSILLIKCK